MRPKLKAARLDRGLAVRPQKALVEAPSAPKGHCRATTSHVLGAALTAPAGCGVSGSAWVDSRLSLNIHAVNGSCSAVRASKSVALDSKEILIANVGGK